MSSKLSEHDEIIAEAREKYTVHNCDQCEFRKSCINEFDSEECKKLRQSIMLGFGIEDGYFTKILDRLEAAHKRDIEDAATCKDSLQVGNTAKMREVVMELLDIMYDMGIDEETTAISVESSSCHTSEHPVAKVIKKARAALASPPEPVGDNAKMREALVKIKECYDNDYLSLDYDSGDVLGNAALLAENALSAPPRNCDLYETEEDAWEAFSSDRQGADSSTEEFEKWLFAEAKGEAK